MAGIGFELKKLFAKKGLLSLMKAYGYAGVVCTGPMLLGIALLLGIKMLAQLGGADTHSIELLNCMITYTLLASLLMSSLFAMATTRFLADALFEEKDELVMPSFYGSLAIMLVIGCTLYGVFLWNAGIPLIYQLACLILFGELVIVWTEISYLTAVKDYRAILKTFFYALLIVFLSGYLLIKVGVSIVISLMIAMTIGYGIMMVWYFCIMVTYFPKGKGSAFYFLRWVDRYPALVFLSEWIVLGLFIHLVLMWFSPIGIQVQGLFYGAPIYDIPAELAFLSILITTVNFVTSVEVNFYPKYSDYITLFNSGGSLTDIIQAEFEMRVVLQKELEYTFIKQLITTVAFVVVGSVFIPKLPLYFSDQMIEIYSVLCVGYAFYAVGNCAMLILLYFSDNTGAFWSGLFFAVISISGTILLRNQSPIYYGFGFAIGGLAFASIALLRLFYYTKRLSYYILSTQPIILKERRTIITKLCEYLERRYQRKYGTKEAKI
jgi:uncharacterized membrane protein